MHSTMFRCTFTPAGMRHLERRSTRIVFCIAGLGVAAWAPLVPFAKERAGVGVARWACCSSASASTRWPWDV
jgi:hypothetical protein